MGNQNCSFWWPTDQFQWIWKLAKQPILVIRYQKPKSGQFHLLSHVTSLASLFAIFFNWIRITLSHILPNQNSNSITTQPPSFSFSLRTNKVCIFINLTSLCVQFYNFCFCLHSSGIFPPWWHPNFVIFTNHQIAIKGLSFANPFVYETLDSCHFQISMMLFSSFSQCRYKSCFDKQQSFCICMNSKSKNRFHVLTQEGSTQNKWAGTI